jgi:hypothetical protein
VVGEGLGGLIFREVIWFAFLRVAPIHTFSEKKEIIMPLSETASVKASCWRSSGWRGRKQRQLEGVCPPSSCFIVRDNLLKRYLFEVSSLQGFGIFETPSPRSSRQCAFPQSTSLRANQISRFKDPTVSKYKFKL